ncbi:hypothetical protein HYT54_04000 [Candidatus Woesearchaeota archaeon]|nr:hypothetical protein [Candidatus Woesearchaeota archaeon]
MARSYFENWMEIFFILIMLLGIVMAVVVRSNIVSYMTITAAGVAAGKIIFERKNKVRFPYILIIIGFIIGYVIGAYDASRQLVLLLFVASSLITYNVLEKGWIYY